LARKKPTVAARLYKLEKERERAREREKERERDLHTGSSNHLRNMRRNNSDFQRALH
jgi:hypothetical protein